MTARQPIESVSPVAAGVVLELQAGVLAQPGLAPSASALANELARALRCDRVSVGWIESGSIRVIATSNSVDFDPRHTLFEKIGAAMDEAVEQAATITLPADGPGLAVTLAHSEVLGLIGGSVCTVPLADAGRCVGAVTLERGERPFAPADVHFAENVACLVAPILELKRRGERPVIKVALDAWRQSLSKLTGSYARVRLAGLGLVVFAAVAFVPVSYHVSAPARIEGSVQRVVAAPIDGFLEQVNVRPGDRVREGQVIAELAQRDLKTERAKRQSELAQQENLYGAALARADRAQLVIHHAKVSEARAQLELIESHVERAHIRAPFEGIVLKGDLLQSLGAPVQRGEILMTLAPNERFRVIVEVDERDVAQVQPGQQGGLVVAAAPGQAQAFRVSRILPMAVAADGRNYFEVEADFDAAPGALRPGMRGVAKIESGERSLLWIVTHRVIDWLRLVAWSLGA